MNIVESQNENPDFINYYLKYTHYISGCSNQTIKELYYDIRTFLRYLYYINDKELLNDFTMEKFRKIPIINFTIEDVKSVNTTTINDYIFFLRNVLDNSPKTRNRKLASIKNFYNYLYTNNYITVDPARNISSCNIEKRNPKFLNLDESKKMLSLTLKSKERNNLRNYTMICILLNCCLRVNELININIPDIDFEAKTLKITGKGNKQRIVYINEATEEAIKEYLKIRPELSKTDPNYYALFLSEQKKRVSKRTAQYVSEHGFNRVFEDNNRGLHAHSLRHTGATLMYDENDTSVLILQKILGHNQLTSTEIYTHVSNKKLENIMKNFAISSLVENMEVTKNE